MKKLFIVVASLALIGCFAAIGCGGGTSGDSAGQDAAQSGEATEAATYDSVEAFTEAHASSANYEFAAMAAFPCATCHGMDENALYEAYQSDPESITVPRDTCIGCHSEAAWPDELEATYENIKHWDTYVGVGTEEHQAWVNGALEYTTGRPPMGDYEMECASCHKMHADKPIMSCTACHNPDQGTGDCMVCHERLLGEGMEFEGKTAEEATATLMERLEANGSHIDSVMTAPDGWDEAPSLMS